jgi:hypothetical protein
LRKSGLIVEYVTYYWFDLVNLSIGLRISPAVFQRLMNTVFTDQLHEALLICVSVPFFSSLNQEIQEIHSGRDDVVYLLCTLHTVFPTLKPPLLIGLYLYILLASPLSTPAAYSSSSP